VRPLRQLSYCLTAITLTACSAVVDVNGYAFEESPCGPRPVSCTGGRQLAFVVRAIDIPRIDDAGLRDGFDLDGTADAICGREDLVSPTGAVGVDNQLAELLEVLEMLGMTNTRTESASAALTGEPVALLVLEHVDDLASDDCIEVTQRTGYLPMGMTADLLDGNRDGLLDPDLTFDYGTSREHDPVACTVDGVVHARFAATTRPSPIGGGEVTAHRGRMRLDTRGTEVRMGLLGGSLRIADLPMLDVTQRGVLLQRADLDPTARGSDDCASISFALVMEAVPARPGAYRDTP